jgi:hypothetical protein
MLTIQYLEYSPDLAQLDHAILLERLRDAVKVLPVTHLLIGWSLPPGLLKAFRVEVDRLGLRFLRWQPLLTSDHEIQIVPSWHVEGLDGGKVMGFGGLPAFTFLCPNHPDVRDALMEHLVSLIHTGIYQGFFLDRVRYPSPAFDPEQHMACFCEHCCRKAAEDGLDLPAIRMEILRQTSREEGRIAYVKSLLAGLTGFTTDEQAKAVGQMIAFRQRSIQDFIEPIIQLLRSNNMEVGVDCFSPCLAPMVGQDLAGLCRQADWVKLMTYAHTYAPAGLPFELSGLQHYLTHTTRLKEKETLELIHRATGLPLPRDRRSMEIQGLSSAALTTEITRGMETTSSPVLAGIELVDLPGVTRLSPAQIHADLAAVKHVQPAGLALSWDLLHIPLDWLGLVRDVYFSN